MSIADKGRPSRSFASWFAPLFFAGIALGALLFAGNFVFNPLGDLASGGSALAGPEYAQEQLAAFASRPLLIYVHALLGIAIVLLVPFQFWRNFRNRHRTAHRRMGYVTLSSLALLAVTGVAVAIAYPFSGVPGIVPNLLWACGILTCLTLAFRNIRRRNIAEHERWMTRAVAMTLGITFATLYLPILTGVLHLPPRTALAVSFWLGVGECLLVAELWLRRNRPAARP